MEMLFVWLVVFMAVFYAFRYALVHIQCRRANGYAHYLSVQNIEMCSDAFLTIQNSEMFEEQKADLRVIVKKCMARTQDY